ncbi:MAG: hypothetical protein AAFU85_29035, partial [Planctomycetota bacterium]
QNRDGRGVSQTAGEPSTTAQDVESSGATIFTGIVRRDGSGLSLVGSPQPATPQPVATQPAAPQPAATQPAPLSAFVAAT